MSTAQDITPELVTERLRHVVADLLEMNPAELDPDVPLSAYGIDSMTSSVLAGDLEKWCGVQLPPDASLGRLTLTEAADEVVTALARAPRPPQPTKER
ncbi:acyl carrier protein [Streptomyces rimosus]|uniref:acyl carrier protein n=1 Tax=Streptomyces rimosus TaxID=1927 RepID=UPI0005191C68|nr:acyl carrier protein [Streptomyces rimosus]